MEDWKLLPFNKKYALIFVKRPSSVGSGPTRLFELNIKFFSMLVSNLERAQTIFGYKFDD